MQTKVFSWLGRELVEISGEGRPGASIEEETRALLRRFEGELTGLGLSLANTVRTRLWGRDKEARMRGTAARSQILTGAAKAASSSFISQNHFDSDAKVAVDLFAMKPLSPAAERKPIEFEPPRNYLRFLRYDSVVYFSGFTSEAAALEAQVVETLETLDAAIAAAGTDWKKVGKLSIFARRGEDVNVVKTALVKANRLSVPEIECVFVDGFAGEKYLLEIEATAMA